MRKAKPIKPINEDKLLKVWARQIHLVTELYKIDLIEPSYHILSFGGGRQTWYLLLKMKKLFSNNPKAFVIFADTGNEHSETYSYIDNYVIPFCKLWNIQFVHVYNKYGKTLYDYCFERKIVPSMKFRRCTQDFKILPIRRMMRNELKITRKNPCNVYIGISYDEADRMNVSNVQYARSVFPLIDGYRDIIPEGRITAAQCVQGIKDLGYPEIIKSGCTMCPYSRPLDLINPEYVEKNIALEENNSRFPEIKLTGTKYARTVKQMKALKTEQLLEESKSCKSGYCMV